ncbi:MAG: IscS subfamily cysteine desulfurase [Candidatus Omnitrophota bacterium]
MKLPIYMDNASTTRADPRVIEVMLPCFDEVYGNAASRSHPFGWKAEEKAEEARTHIAGLINADPKEIVFTSGGTESINLALKGLCEIYREKGNHLIVGATEYRAVIEVARRMERGGFRVTYLPVDRYGVADPEALEKEMTDQTILVAFMLGNHEIGTLHPVAEIGKLAKEKGVFFFCDLAASQGYIPIDVQAMGIDLAAFSAHKIYGPKGVGALYVRKKNPRVRLSPLIDGGGAERGMRSGTLDVPAIVGFGKACEIAHQEMDQERKRLWKLNERLRQGLEASLSHIQLNGHPTQRLPHILNMSFLFAEGESILMGIRDVALSSGSACTTATLEPSYILMALGLDAGRAHTSIRFSIGRFNTEEEIDFTMKRVTETVSRLRDMSPLYEAAKESIDLKNTRQNNDK